MFFFNLPGFLGALACALLAWGITWSGKRLGFDVGVEEFLLAWPFLLSVFAILYDRVPAGRMWRCYLNYIGQFEGRIAVCGCPLLAAPVVILVFSFAFPLKDGHPLPSLGYFLAQASIGAGALAVAIATAPWRTVARHELKLTPPTSDEVAGPPIVASSHPPQMTPHKFTDTAITDTPTVRPENRAQGNSDPATAIMDSLAPTIPYRESKQASEPLVSVLSLFPFDRRSKRAQTWFWIFAPLMPISAVGAVLAFFLMQGEMQDLLLVSLVILFCIGLGGTLLMWLDRAQSEYQMTFLKVIDRMGLCLLENPDPSLYGFLHSLHLLSWAKQVRASNVLTGELNGYRILILTCKADAISYTVFALPNALPGKCDFILHAKQHLSAFSPWLPKTWIEAPGLEDRFILTGPELEKVAGYCTPRVANLCLDDPNLVMEVRDSNLVFLGRASPEEYSLVISLAIRFAEALKAVSR